MLGCVRLNITARDIRNWDSVESVKESFASEFPDYSNMPDDRIRFTIEPNMFLDMVEIRADDRFADHFVKRLHNSTCLLLVKDDCSELMFAKDELLITGDIRLRKYKFGRAEPRNSDVARLRELRCGDASSFEGLFDTKDVVKRFYGEYKVWLGRLGKSIMGINSTDDRRHYSQILLSRMMFLYFIQTKNFLSSETDYLTRQFAEIEHAKGNFYSDFLLVLFFKVLNTKKKDREISAFDSAPFLNGGLFNEHGIEKKYSIRIENDIFGGILEFLDGWMWYVDDTADDASTTASVNPEILGHIFEQSIADQHSKGAYYTPIDVTQFICNETIVPYCIRRVNERFSSEYERIPKIWESPEHPEYFYFDVLKKIKILDPSCGSGEFILTASKILLDLYTNTWNILEDRESLQVRREREIMAGRPEYYFKRRIVTKNLYGVDIEEGALEICKLRLWLSLVSAMSRDTADPLPNIDYNIMQGNSLVGYTDIPEKQQYSIDGPYDIEDVLREVDRRKGAYNIETDPQMAAHLREAIEQEITPCNDLLNKARASDIAVGEEHRPTERRMEEINPFHWRLHFHEVIMAGGFDIIVGNPPYGAITNYPTVFLKTHKARDTYAYFIEISMKLLKPSGKIGYIIQVPGMATEKMAPLQDLLLDACSVLKISNYDDRPGKLFEGLEHCRSSIILGTKHAKSAEQACAVFTTGYHRWASVDRHSLFKNIRHIPVNFSGLLSCTRNGIPTVISKMSTIPKIGDEKEIGILAKIYQKSSLVQATCKRSDLAVYYHSAPQYWIHAMGVKKFNKDVKDSTEVKFVELKDRKAFTITLSLLNSSLFYWFFIKMSDCRHLNKREVNNMPVGIDEFTSADVSKLTRLTRALMKNYKDNSKIKTNSSGTLREEIYPKHAKSIIDKIDNMLAKHYGFTQNEAAYIKQFDEKFRLGDD